MIYQLRSTSVSVNPEISCGQKRSNVLTICRNLNAQPTEDKRSLKGRRRDTFEYAPTAALNIGEYEEEWVQARPRMDPDAYMNSRR
jgi:hypothetical protein